MDTVDTLVSRNKTFAAQGRQDGLSLMPTLRTIVIGCADPRVDPADVLGLNLGEALVIRNVGGRVVPATLQTLGLLAMIGRAEGLRPGPGWNIVVLHHTDCGITRLNAHPDALGPFFGLNGDELSTMEVMDPWTAVAVDVATLKATPGVPAPWLVSGLVYDVATGRVDVVSAPSPVRDS
ncbi:MAG TPA: carbonic anhydrase [Pseudonocardiaceae bacterium]|jgi:carbonic anhydrase|nr:carbonic anhydrase [Pseudonocardiaceae bacterium]